MRVDSPSQSQSAFKPGLYAAPLPGEALRIGHSGPAVLELQQKLNALGAKPPLATDGKLGPKTQAAMKALLGTKPTPPAKPVDGFQPGKPAIPSPSTIPAPAASGVGLEKLPPRDPNAVTGSHPAAWWPGTVRQLDRPRPCALQVTSFFSTSGK